MEDGQVTLGLDYHTMIVNAQTGEFMNPADLKDNLLKCPDIITWNDISETACSCRRSDSASCGRGGLDSRQHCLIRRGSVAGYTAECAETGAGRLQKRLLPCAAGLYAVAGHDDDQRTGGGRQRADSDHTALFVGRWTW